MTTTLQKYAGKRAANYSTNPTIDVEILDAPFECSTCDGEVEYDLKLGRFVHDPADFECEGHESLNGADMGASVFCDGSCNPEHRVDIKPKCTYCGALGTLTYTAHAWYDAQECSRCGGIAGWALGD